MLSPAPAAVPVVGIANQHLTRRHRPEQTALYPVIETNLTPFLEHLHEHDAALPRFVTDEFEDYLRCGRLEGADAQARRAGRHVECAQTLHGGA